ncbi:MAG TPA: cation transporter [Chromatiales bacterium]|nr:cation transporter [Chromatiales bacterium]
MSAHASTRVILAALIGNLLVALTKFAAAVLTGSSAMFSEGIHSLVDTGNQILLLYGMHRARRPADRQHPFGYGKEVYFWSFVVALLIFALGAGISLYEGIHHVQHPTPLERPVVNYVVLGLALVFEGFSWAVALHEFRRNKGRLGYFEAVHRGKDPTLFVVLFEDSAAMFGLLTALGGVAAAHLLQRPVFDGIASIVIGLILGITAIWLAVETKGLLIGESARAETVEQIRRMARKLSGVEDVNEVLTLHMGPDYVLLNVSLDFRDDLPASEVEERIAEFERLVRQRFPEIRRVFVEAESRLGRLKGRARSR